MEKELIRYFIEECKQKQGWTKRWYDNYMEMDSWFKYSGKIEKDTEDYTNLIIAQETIKEPKRPRKDYFRMYWLKQKHKKNGKHNK